MAATMLSDGNKRSNNIKSFHNLIYPSLIIQPPVRLINQIVDVEKQDLRIILFMMQKSSQHDFSGDQKECERDRQAD